MRLDIKKVGSVIAAGVIGMLAASSEAGAVNINTHATACAADSPSSQIEFRYSSIYNAATGSDDVVCPVERSPLASGATTASFYVDGLNMGGVSTTCWLYSFNYNGTFLASTSFTSSAATYDQLLTFTAANAPTYAYISLDCYLPGNGNAGLRGITSVQ
jgi:hypothetical protein